jgi:sorbitol-specific phosphotransferase system component IIA
MVIEIDDKELETFLNSLNKTEIKEFVEKAIKDKMLIYDAKKAVNEVKTQNLIEEDEFFKRINEN